MYLEKNSLYIFLLIYLSVLIISCGGEGDLTENDNLNNVVIFDTTKYNISDSDIDLDSLEGIIKDDPLFNMVYIETEDFIRGDTNLPSEALAEQLNKVSFSYNFYIDKTEIPQWYYYVITKKMPPSFFIYTEQNWFLPVGKLSFYDAVLFCNERSKYYGLDTVYSYTAINEDGSLKDLNADFSKSGFALPTEAEWEFVAQKAWDGYDDSYIFAGEPLTGTLPKKVEELQPDKLGLYNLFGNMMEITWSIYDEYEYTYYLNPDLKNLEIKEDTKIVGRGGNWGTVKSQINPAWRFALVPTSRELSYGIRCVIRDFKEDIYKEIVNPEVESEDSSSEDTNIDEHVSDSTSTIINDSTNIMPEDSVNLPDTTTIDDTTSIIDSLETDSTIYIDSAYVDSFSVLPIDASNLF